MTSTRGAVLLDAPTPTWPATDFDACLDLGEHDRTRRHPRGDCPTEPHTLIPPDPSTWDWDDLPKVEPTPLNSARPTTGTEWQPKDALSAPLPLLPAQPTPKAAPSPQEPTQAPPLSPGERVLAQITNLGRYSKSPTYKRAISDVLAVLAACAPECHEAGHR